MSSKPVWGVPPENLGPITGENIPAPELPPSALRIRDGIFAVVIYIGAQIGAALLLVIVVAFYWGMRYGKDGAVMRIEPFATSTAFVIATIVASLTFVFFFSRYLARRSGSGWRVLGFVRPETRWFPIAFVALIICVAISYCFNLIAGPDVIKRAGDTMSFFADTDPLMIWPMVLIVCVIVPVAEEVVFRAILFRSLINRFSAPVAGVLSVATFSLVHAQYLMSGFDVALLMMAQVALLGGTLTWLYYKSGSIWPSVMLHVLNNSWAMLGLLLWPDSGF